MKTKLNDEIDRCIVLLIELKEEAKRKVSFCEINKSAVKRTRIKINDILIKVTRSDK